MQNIKVYEADIVTNSELKEISLQDVINKISSECYKDRILKIRNGKEDKLLLPYFCLSKFTNNYRRKENFQYTELIGFDLDKIENFKVIKDLLKKDPRTYILYNTTSGTGLRLICRLQEQIKSNENYEHAYGIYKKVFEKLTGIKFDKTSDTTRAWFYSYDPDIFVNENCEALSTDISGNFSDISEIPSISGKYFTPITEGARNDTLTSYAGLLKSSGISGDLLRNIVLDYNKNHCTPSLSEKEVHTIIKSIGKYETKKIIRPPATIRDIMNELYSTLTTGDERRIKTGINMFDLSMHGGMMAGEVMGIVGNTGGFKSTLALNIILKHCLNSPVIYVSLEMPVYMVAMRVIQILTGFDYETIRKNIKTDNVDFKNQIQAIIKNYLDKIQFINRRIDVGDISAIISQGKEYFQKDVSLLILDHAGLIRSNYKTEYERMSDIADSLIYRAMEHNLTVISVYQTSREDIKNRFLTLNSFKGSGNIENSLRYALVLNAVNEKNLKDIYYSQNSKLTQLDGMLYHKLIENNYSLVNVELAKNSTGAYGKKEVLLFDRKSLRMITLQDYLNPLYNNFLN